MASQPSLAGKPIIVLGSLFRLAALTATIAELVLCEEAQTQDRPFGR